MFVVLGMAVGHKGQTGLAALEPNPCEHGLGITTISTSLSSNDTRT